MHTPEHLMVSSVLTAQEPSSPRGNPTQVVSLASLYSPDHLKERLSTTQKILGQGEGRLQSLGTPKSPGPGYFSGCCPLVSLLVCTVKHWGFQGLWSYSSHILSELFLSLPLATFSNLQAPLPIPSNLWDFLMATEAKLIFYLPVSSQHGKMGRRVDPGAWLPKVESQLHHSAAVTSPPCVSVS